MVSVIASRAKYPLNGTATRAFPKRKRRLERRRSSPRQVIDPYRDEFGWGLFPAARHPAGGFLLGLLGALSPGHLDLGARLLLRPALLLGRLARIAAYEIADRRAKAQEVERGGRA